MAKIVMSVSCAILAKGKDPIPYTATHMTLEEAKRTKKQLVAKKLFTSVKIYKETFYKEVKEIKR